MIYKKDANFPYPLLTNTSNSYDGCNFILDIGLNENTYNYIIQIDYDIEFADEILIDKYKEISKCNDEDIISVGN